MSHPPGVGGVEVLFAPVSDAVVQEVADTIAQLHRDASLQLSIQIGRIIVERFYGGDIALWKERGVKDVSLRKLATHLSGEGDRELCATKLYRMVAIYELEGRIELSNRVHLTATHARAVLGLPVDEQRRLVTCAEAGRWDTRRLEEEAAEVRRREAKGRGRPPLPAFVKDIGKLGKFVEDGAEPFGELEKLGGLEDQEVDRLHRTVVEVRRKCEELERVFEERLRARGGGGS